MRRAAAIYRRTAGRRVRWIGVGGSFGKTTAAAAISAVLDLPARRPPYRNATSHFALRILTTPPWRRHGVVEIGVAVPGEMGRYCGVLLPDVAVVLSIGSEHHTSFRTLDAIAAEEAELVRALGSGGTAYLNADDPRVGAMSADCRGRVVSFGFGEGCAVRGRELELRWPVGMRFTVEAPGLERFDVQTRLLGGRMATAALAAIAVGLHEGISPADLQQRLARMEACDGRMQLQTLPSGAVLIRDDFKSAQETIVAAMETLAAVPAVRRVLVLGDVTEPFGSANQVYHDYGERSVSSADFALFLGSGWRKFMAGARRVPGGERRALAMPRDVAGAIRWLHANLREGDAVVIKGRSEERLGRIAHALGGREVRCTIPVCHFKATACGQCAMLERGWDRQ